MGFFAFNPCIIPECLYDQIFMGSITHTRFICGQAECLINGLLWELEYVEAITPDNDSDQAFNHSGQPDQDMELRTP